MKSINLIAIGLVCVTLIVIANILACEPKIAIVDPKEKMGQWYEVLCIEEDGSADRYTIPVPEFKGFSEEFVADYYELSGQQFCDSIKDKTQYLYDVGEEE